MRPHRRGPCLGSATTVELLASEEDDAPGFGVRVGAARGKHHDERRGTGHEYEGGGRARSVHARHATAGELSDPRLPQVQLDSRVLEDVPYRIDERAATVRHVLEVAPRDRAVLPGEFE